MKRAATLIAAGLWTIATAAAAQSVDLRGPAGATRTVTAADLAALPRQSVSLTAEHGAPRRYEGPPLTLLLQSVGAPAGKALRGPALADIVVVTARDGYRVSLSLAETDPGMRKEAIILADRADGAPLPASEGPFRLIVEGDLRAARSAKMVTSITVTAAP
jgi:DMSO/TMAO reductase YedYZ molybdopterin-dependent catalytic subunit